MNSNKIFDLEFHTYDIDINTGYGKAAYFLKTELDKEINVIDRSKNVLNFCMPKDYIYKDLTIGYTPWESTELLPGWRGKMQRCEEIWTPSEWNAKLFKDKLLSKEVFILPHGIDPEFITVKHHWDHGPFTFLHIGAPAERKGDDILFKVWYKHFSKNKNVRLVFKSTNGVSARIKNKYGSIIAGPNDIENIIVKTGFYSQIQLWREMILAHCMVYPSRGEGWGLIPFESLASGLPTIVPGQGMGDFTKNALCLENSKWVKSENQVIHPGLWMEHDEDELIHLMESAITCYEREADIAYVNGKLIHHDYAWNKIAEKAIERLNKITDLSIHRINLN